MIRVCEEWGKVKSMQIFTYRVLHRMAVRALF